MADQKDLLRRCAAAGLPAELLADLCIALGKLIAFEEKAVAAARYHADKRESKRGRDERRRIRLLTRQAEAEGRGNG